MNDEHTVTQSLFRRMVVPELVIPRADAEVEEERAMGINRIRYQRQLIEKIEQSRTRRQTKKPLIK